MKKGKNHITPQEIQRYLNNEMSASERHEFEKASLEDDFAFEALEGLENLKSEEFRMDMADLNKRLSDRVSQKSGFSYWKIAATILIIGLVGGIVFISVPDISKDVSPIAQESTENEPVPSGSSNLDSGSNESNQTDSIRIIDEQIALLKEDEKALLKEKSTAIREENYHSDTSPSTGTKPLATIEGIEEIKETDFEDDEILITEAELQTEHELVGTVKGEELNNKTKAGLSAEESRNLTDIQTMDRSSSAPSSRAAYIPGQSRTITGTILDANGHTGIQSVTIGIPSENLEVQTDENGRFRILAPAGISKLVAQKQGYDSHEFNVEEHNNFEITLNRENDMMTEVYITEYGLRSVEEMDIESQDNAAPEIGVQRYNRYLRDSVFLPQQARENNISGRVIVQFEVLPSGNLTNFNIIKSLGYGCDEEAIRLIQEGTSWQPATVNGIEVTQEVKVIVRFK